MHKLRWNYYQSGGLSAKHVWAEIGRHHLHQHGGKPKPCFWTRMWTSGNRWGRTLFFVVCQHWQEMTQKGNLQRQTTTTNTKFDIGRLESITHTHLNHPNKNKHTHTTKTQQQIQQRKQQTYPDFRNWKTNSPETQSWNHSNTKNHNKTSRSNKYDHATENRKQKEIEDYLKWWETSEERQSANHKKMDGPPRHNKTQNTSRKTIAWTKA